MTRRTNSRALHVFGSGHAKINLTGSDGRPELAWADDMKRNEVRRAMAIVTEHRQAFWRDGGTYMAELSDAAIDAALERGRARANEPRAAAARYDSAADRVIVDLENGCTFAFPPHLAQGLEAASQDQLAAVEILGQGYGLHWESLNVGLSLPDLMAGLFGTKAWMAPCRASHVCRQSSRIACQWIQRGGLGRRHISRAPVAGVASGMNQKKGRARGTAQV